MTDSVSPVPPIASRPLVVIAENLSDEASDWLAHHCEVIHAAVEDARFIDAAHDVQALVVRTYTQVDEALLALLPQLKVVGRAGVGLDNIDLAACKARGIVVVSTPDANTQAVVEYVLCLLCDALRPRVFLECAVDKTEWDELRQEVVGLWQMDEMVLGILGMGRVGKRVAQVARAIGFRVLYHDIVAIPFAECHGAECVSLHDLFAHSDVLSIHIDGGAANNGFVSATLLAQLHTDAILINTARGNVIDHHALAVWLRANPAGSALLDVHSPEPFVAGNPLIALPNAHLAPHLASRTVTAMNNMSWVVRDVAEVLQGRTPKFPCA